MEAKNMNQLNAMLMKRLTKAMNVASKKMKADMCKETEDFYTGNQPVMYERTGALGETPRVTDIQAIHSNNGGEVSFEAYLDTTHQYTTGDNPNMQQVLELANDGIRWTTESGALARPTVGKGKFWDRAKDKMESTLNGTLGEFFTK